MPACRALRSPPPWLSSPLTYTYSPLLTLTHPYSPLLTRSSSTSWTARRPPGQARLRPDQQVLQRLPCGQDDQVDHAHAQGRREPRRQRDPNPSPNPNPSPDHNPSPNSSPSPSPSPSPNAGSGQTYREGCEPTLYCINHGRVNAWRRGGFHLMQIWECEVDPSARYTP